MLFVAPANIFLAYAPPLAALLAFRRAAALNESDPRIVTHGFLAGVPAVIPVLAALVLLAGPLTAGLASVGFPSIGFPSAASPAVPTFLGRVVRSFGLSATIEELSKLAALALVVRIHRARLTGRVVVLAGAATGAGFAFVENGLYLIDLPRVLALRLLTAGVLHVSVSAICGYGIAVVAYRYGRMLPWVLCAIALHGGYNYLIELGGVPAIWAPLVPVTAAIIAWSRYNHAERFRLPGRRTRAYPDS